MIRVRDNFPEINSGSYMGAHDLLNLSSELRKRDNLRGLSSILSLFFATSLINHEHPCKIHKLILRLEDV